MPMPTIAAENETTIQNLLAAFEGESNAHAKYIAFAVKADQDGILGAASLFRAAGRAEQIHAANHARVIKQLGGEAKCVVDGGGRVEWSYAAPNANDIWVLPNGNLLFNTGHGAEEVTRDRAVVFSYESTSEVYACQRLPNGNTFIGESNAGRLLEVNPAGRIVRQIRLLPEGKDGGSAYMRNARRLANGNYLVAHYGDQVVREYDPQGKVVWQVAAPGGPHSVVRLPDGNTL